MTQLGRLRMEKYFDYDKMVNPPELKEGQFCISAELASAFFRMQDDFYANAEPKMHYKFDGTLHCYFRTMKFLCPCTDEELPELKQRYIIENNSILMGYNKMSEIPDFYNTIEQIPGTYTVYCHTSPNGKKYVGITNGKPEYRWDNGNGYKSQTKFYNAIKKHKWENFTHEILVEGVNAMTASKLEQYYISVFDSYKHGYNANMGGLGSDQLCNFHGR